MGPHRMRHRHPLTSALLGSSKRTSWATYALVAASFGPYVVPSHGLMTIQLVLYPLAVWALWQLVTARDLARVRHILPVVMVFACMVIWVIAATMFSTRSAPILAILAQLDSYAQPLLVLLIMAAVALGRSTEESLRLLRGSTVLLTVLLTANTGIALWSALTGLYPSELLAPWTKAADIERTVMGRAAIGMARYTGVFPSPATSGIAYGVGVLLAVYWLKRDQSPILGLIMVMLMVVGGGLAKSKAFYVGAVLGGAYLLVGPRVSRGVIAVAAAVAVLAAMVGSLGLGDWAFHSGIAEKFDSSDHSLAYSLSGGRYGEGGVTVRQLGKWVIASPWIGYGLTNAQLGPLDSEPLAHLTAGGVPALAMYLTALALVMYAGGRAVRAGSPDGWLTLFMGLLVLLEGLGRPALGANMAGPVLTTMLALGLSLLKVPPAPAAHTDSKPSSMRGCAVGPSN